MRHRRAGQRAAGWLATCLVVATVASSGQALARDPVATTPERPPPPPLVGVHLRVLPIFLMFTFLDSDVMAPTLGGLSAGLEVQRRWLLEFGSSRMPWKGRHMGESGADAFVRGGYLGTFLDRRGTDGRGWVLQAFGLFGYRYLVLDIGNDASHDSWPHEGMAVNAGLETKRYWSPRVGFSIRLLLGGSLLWRRDLVRDSVAMMQYPNGPLEMSWAFDVGLDLGLVF